ncbi:hypothetical protein AU255_16840 [Methyloprofundus sedimenti]|uniref:Cytochrome c domain-containing protein n=1 Tax=Methyloprofundus sedimenti TaxID=1420851 RepID=A0A1V8M300_9GAMM|nr:hypothetical protein [Methyloprofundus sedimenti]OQK15856.1 hypothetical protein AU255_16840 [Methyloprofundus sedimenti]
MQYTKTPTLSLAFTLIITLIMLQTQAAAEQIKLPPETAKLRVSKLPGYTLATQQCLICHSADYINYQAPDMTQSQWTNEVFKMQRSYGAMFSEHEARSIGAYLAVAYGNAKATDDSVVAASKLDPSAENSNANTIIDVQVLLNNNGCLACHAINKKLVGPAFHEIATKYKGDAGAKSKLAASIQKGVPENGGKCLCRQ